MTEFGLGVCACVPGLRICCRQELERRHVVLSEQLMVSADVCIKIQVGARVCLCACVCLLNQDMRGGRWRCRWDRKCEACTDCGALAHAHLWCMSWTVFGVWNSTNRVRVVQTNPNIVNEVDGAIHNSPGSFKAQDCDVLHVLHVLWCSEHAQQFSSAPSGHRYSIRSQHLQKMVWSKRSTPSSKDRFVQP